MDGSSEVDNTDRLSEVILLEVCDNQLFQEWSAVIETLCKCTFIELEDSVVVLNKRL